MALLTEQKVVPTGLNVSLVAAAAGGDSFANGGTQKAMFRNASGGAITVTVDTPNPDNFGVSNNVLDVTVTVPAGATVIAGPFRTDRHNDVNGRVQLTYSGVTTFTVAILNE